MTGSSAASSVVLIIEEELARWKAGKPSLARRQETNAKPSKGGSLLFRSAAKDSEGACKTLAPFLHAALGGAPGVTHDAACRALQALVLGAYERDGGVLDNNGEAMALVQSLVPSLHPGETVSALPPALRRSVHEILWQKEDTLVFAVPSLTRHGAAVLPTPPRVLQLLRPAYFEALADLTCDPTSVRKHGQGESIIVGSTKLAAKGADALKRGLVEWAVVPEHLHETVLEEMRPVCEAWCGQELVPVRFFGVRRYYRGAGLTSHIDSDPSCRAIGVSITVDIEELDEPWPLKARSAHADEPAAAAALPVGQCFVYEASRVHHHRDQPLKGRVFANCYCHYTVKGWHKEHTMPSEAIGRASLEQVREACRIVAR
jgi:hypothetical protein